MKIIHRKLARQRPPGANRRTQGPGEERGRQVGFHLGKASQHVHRVHRVHDVHDVFDYWTGGRQSARLAGKRRAG